MRRPLITVSPVSSSSSQTTRKAPSEEQAPMSGRSTGRADARIDGPEVRGLARRVHGAGLDRGPRRPDDRPGGGTGGRGLGESLVFARGGQGHDIARRCPVPVHDPRPDVAVVAARRRAPARRRGSARPGRRRRRPAVPWPFPSRRRRGRSSGAPRRRSPERAPGTRTGRWTFWFSVSCGGPPRSLIRTFRRRPKGEKDS